jgi:hypothetical protein
MTTTHRLQRISEADLDGLIAELRRQGTRELVLLGPKVHLPASVDQWPQDLRDKLRIYQIEPRKRQDNPRIYQFMEPVAGLAERLGQLTQLTSLTLWSNEIGDEGAAALSALTQLTSLDLGGNEGSGVSGSPHPAHLPGPAVQQDRC